MSGAWYDAIEWQEVVRALVKMAVLAAGVLSAQHAVSPPSIEQTQCAEVIRQTILWCEQTKASQP